jgi:hypothetical protein
MEKIKINFSDESIPYYNNKPYFIQFHNPITIPINTMKKVIKKTWPEMSENDKICYLKQKLKYYNSCIKLIESEYKLNSSSEENTESEIKVNDYKDSIKKLKNKSKIK